MNLTDGDLVKSTLLPSHLRVKLHGYSLNFQIRRLSMPLLLQLQEAEDRMFGAEPESGNRSLEVSDDGKNFTKVTDITTGRIAQNTLTFTPVTGKFFRFRS